ncbi:sulfotransferase family protein [Parvicella tangerina]|uniref:Sulfotransferase n=1 Tax=Parvicella tangerina TaxID=2829795 RepID=A0A916JNS5_9FLAO|nr:sulfotransferase [Parvicella tangerina]CAG5084303.1 hypothetical protein CRYO30217_02431 [Parvicella tangerina]
MSEIIRRIFIVGSPRSGTTLLQSLVASHSWIQTFPESHFFYNMGDTGRLRKFLHLANTVASKSTIQRWLTECDRRDLANYLPDGATYSAHVKAFVYLLDRMTRENNKQIWVEKTPLHLHYIKYIERYVETPLFIHIVRNGVDVVSSVYDIANNDLNKWGGNRSLEHCINRWELDIRLSANELGKENHFFVRYENLVANPVQSLEHLFKFLRIEFEKDILVRRISEKQDYILPSESWKSDVSKEIKLRTNIERLRSLTKKELEILQNRVNKIDLTKF